MFFFTQNTYWGTQPKTKLIMEMLMMDQIAHFELLIIKKKYVYIHGIEENVIEFFSVASQ